MIWPIITAIMFARMERTSAFIWSMLAGYMFLPPNIAIDLPTLPGLGKNEIMSMSAMLMLWLGMGKKSGERDPMEADLAPVIPRSMVLMISMMFLSIILTGISNGSPLVEGVSYKPGVDTTQIIGNLLLQYVELIPFFVAFKLLSTPSQTRKLLRAFMIAFLIYSLPMLMEVRLSPQLNTWIYGYFQHDFAQTFRYNGYRPIVFMNHPIWVASFATTGFLAALCLARAYGAGPRMIFLLLYLAAVLVLCKTMTAILMSLMAAPLILFAAPRTVLTFSMILTLIMVSYPVLRLFNVLPTDEIVAFIEESQPERAGSLAFRFDNEFVLLERAMLQPLFGWGPWGRNFPVNPETGRTLAIADGYWVITFGTRGIFGYLAMFGALATPVFIIWRRRYELLLRHDRPAVLMVATVTLLLAINLFELIPNATLTPLTWLVTGTVLGHACRLRYIRDARGRWKKRQEETPEKTGIRHAL
ncbi:hypothetical protein [Paracoccus tegillarcae]|uniref:hypothetical protein n=1 Tax=Paracoccus tegillarcae TaxID=1529068 RepID=UPI0013004F78|nr:hypothetical protein [Paracoccus tegillarcae]